MNTRTFSVPFLSIALIFTAVLLSGCQSQTDKDTIGAAPPTAPNAKAPSPMAGKPGPIGGGDGPSGGGAATTSAAAPVPVGK